VNGDPDWDIIDGYSRADAIADGLLVEAPGDIAASVGFRCHVALTAAAWEDCVAWTQADGERKGGAVQDESGRLRDVLWMASRAAARRRAAAEGPVPFSLFRVPRAGSSREAAQTSLAAWAGPGDDGELVVTIMLPGED
jgi:hypothetical protein